MAATFSLLSGSASAQTKICVDPGHGGTDPGAVGGTQQEATNVLDTGLRLRNFLNADTADTAGGGSWNVIMTRTTDASVSLSGRASFANTNGAARFMSIHNNAATSTAATGIETFSTSSTGTSADLRNKVQEEAVAVWPLANRGGKTANYSVLVNTSMPAELHEMGFISNSGDRTYLGSATQRDIHARSEMHALQRHYGFAKYNPGTAAVVVTQDNTGANFTLGSTAWFPGTSVPGYVGANYHARATQAVSDPATWTVSLPSGGTYRVDAWWTTATNRSATAPYQVTHTGGTTTVNRNQQVSGGSWQSLGNFSFNAGANTVRLSCWTTVGFYVVADAVRFTKL